MSISNLKLAKAENAVMAHDWKTAARLYKDLLVGDEANEQYLKALANIYVKSGEDEKAIPYFEQIIAFHPHDVDSMNSLGAIYRRLKRFEESITVLQKALAERKNTGMVNYNLGFTYKEMGNFEDAIDAFEIVISGNPNDVLAYNHLGSIYYSTKEYEKSISTFRKGLQVDPNHPILNYNLARCYEATNNTAEAIHCYEAALKTRPGWIDAIRDFSELLINCQETVQAQEMVEQSIKLHPLDTELLCLLGKIYLAENDYEKSTSTYRKAEGIKSDDVKILTGLAKSLEKSSKIDQALGKVEQAVDLEPENKDVRKQYAHTLLSAQRYDQALDNINELYNDKGDKDLQILDLYGQYFICRGNEEVAKFYYDKIKRLNNHYKDYILEAADRFVQTGDYDNAEKYAKDYIEQRPQRPDGYSHLGKVYAAQGKLKHAQQQFEKSISLKKPNIFANKEITRIQDEIQKNPEKYNEESVGPVQPIPEQTATDVDNELESMEPQEEKPIAEIPEEEFDFAQMGGDEIVAEELLKDDDEEFWNSFDDEDEDQSFQETLIEDEKLPEEFFPDNKSVNKADGQEPAPEQAEDITDSRANNISGQEPAMAEPGINEQAAMPEQLMPEQLMPEQLMPEITPEQLPPMPEPLMPTGQDLMDKLDNMEQTLKSHEAELQETDNNIRTALDVEKLAHDLQEQQQAFAEELRKENEQMIHETVEKTVDEKLQNVVDGYEDETLGEPESFDDYEEFDNSELAEELEIAEEPELAEEPEIIEPAILDEPEIIEPASNSEEIGQNEISDEELFNDEQELGDDDFEVDFDFNDDAGPDTDTGLEPMNDEEIAEYEAQKAAEEKEAEDNETIPGFDDQPDMDIFSAQNAVDSLYGESTSSTMLDEETPVITVVEKDGVQELQVQESCLDNDGLASAVEMLNSQEPTDQSDSYEPLDNNSNNDLLNKIEKILSRPEVAREYKDQIELFKKLKMLSTFLPENKQTSFLSCKMRVLMEYIISKMSGKPGLLVTAESLLKSGALGPEYESQLFNSDPAPISDSLVVDVLLTMRELASGLEDKDLVHSLYVNIDGVLEQIELQNQKKDIF